MGDGRGAGSHVRGMFRVRARSQDRENNPAPLLADFDGPLHPVE